MKIITVAALLFSSSAMAANQCKPDDVCLKFESSKSSKAIRCSSISLASITNNEEYGKVLSISVNRRNTIFRYAQENHDEVSTIHLMNESFGLKIDKSIKEDLMMILDNQRKSKAAEALVSCHDYLYSNKLLSRY